MEEEKQYTYKDLADLSSKKLDKILEHKQNAFNARLRDRQHLIGKILWMQDETNKI